LAGRGRGREATRVACVRRVPLPLLSETSMILEDRPVRVRERVTEGGIGSRNLGAAPSGTRECTHTYRRPS